MRTLEHFKTFCDEMSSSASRKDISRLILTRIRRTGFLVRS